MMASKSLAQAIHKAVVKEIRNADSLDNHEHYVSLMSSIAKIAQVKYIEAMVAKERADTEIARAALKVKAKTGPKTLDGASGLRRMCLNLDQQTIDIFLKACPQSISVGARRVAAKDDVSKTVVDALEQFAHQDGRLGGKPSIARYSGPVTSAMIDNCIKALVNLKRIESE